MAKIEDAAFGYLLNDVTLLLRKHFDRRAVKFGLTRAQWRAVKMVYHRPGLRQAELAEYLEMEPMAVGRVIDRLQVADFVERRADPNDRRVWRLHTTQQVAGVVATEMRQALAVMTRIKGNLLALEQMEKALPEDSSAP